MVLLQPPVRTVDTYPVIHKAMTDQRWRSGQALSIARPILDGKAERIE
jgi:hypothetical protein